MTVICCLLAAAEQVVLEPQQGFHLAPEGRRRNATTAADVVDRSARRMRGVDS
jgi:hypothetical protein